MALRAMLENLDELDQSLHDQYKEQDVKIGNKTEKRFVLQVEGVTEHPQVLALKNAHDRQKADNTTLRTERDELKGVAARLEGLPEDFSAEMFNTIKAQAEGKVGNADEQIKRVKEDTEKRVKEAMQKDIDKLAERNKKLDTNLRRRTIDDGLNSALAKAGVAKELLPAARAYIKEQSKIDLVEDGDKLDALVETDLGQRTLDEYVADWAGSDVGKPFIAKPTGGDSGGNDGAPRQVNGNPFVRKDGKIVNRTAIQDAVVKDRGKALQLAKSAGWNDTELKNIGLG
jgi:hypothetical protein